MEKTQTGVVRFFRTERGEHQSWGFIDPDSVENGKKGIFVNFKGIVTEEEDGCRTLFAGEPVEYEVAETERGLHATSVVVLKESQKRIDSRDRIARTKSADNPNSAPTGGRICEAL